MDWNGSRIAFGYFKRLLNVMDHRTALIAERDYHAAHERRTRCAAEHGVPIPLGMAVSVTAECNLSCPGCPATTVDPDRRELSPAELRSLIRQSTDLGLYLFLVLGGEPFLRDDLLELVTGQPDAFFLIFTNGTPLTDGTISTLSRCRNVLVLLSIEGFQDSTDRWRGDGVFNTLMSKMAILSRRRAFFGYSATVTTLNHEEVASPRFVSAMKDAGCRVGFYSGYMTVGETAPPQYRLSTEAVLDFRERLSTLAQTSGMAFISENLENDGCLGGSEFLHISPYGDAEPCPAIHFSTHNVREHSLVEIIQSPLMHNMRRIAQSLSGSRESCVCKSGQYVQLCSGKPQTPEPSTHHLSQAT